MPRKIKTTEKKFTTVPPPTKAATTAPAVPAKAESTPASVQPPIVAKVGQEVLKALAPVPASAQLGASSATGKGEETIGMKPLLTALKDLDADVARQAASSLGQLRDASAVEPLIEIINNTEGYFHSVVRSAAAASLGQLKDSRAVEPLLNAVYDPIADSSSEAIRALANLGDRRAASTLIDVVRNRKGYFANSVRRTAVVSLSKLGGEEAQSELRYVSGDDWEDSEIREEATAAITVGQG